MTDDDFKRDPDDHDAALELTLAAVASRAAQDSGGYDEHLVKITDDTEDTDGGGLGDYDGAASGAGGGSLRFPSAFDDFSSVHVGLEARLREQARVEDAVHVAQRSLSLPPSAAALAPVEEQQPPQEQPAPEQHQEPRQQFLSLAMNASSFSRRKYRRCHRCVKINLFRFSRSILLVLIGIFTGLSGIVIALASGLVTEMKTGLCLGGNGIWKQRKQCCADAPIVLLPNNNQTTQQQQWVLDCPAWYSFADDTRGGYVFAYFVFVSAGACFAMAAYYAVSHHAPQAAGSGIPTLAVCLENFKIPQGFVGWRVLCVKVVGLVLATSSLVAGKEGPLVHIAVCWAGILLSSPWLRSILTFDSNRDGLSELEFMANSAAAGVASAFGSPLGGVAYVQESLWRYRNARQLIDMLLCAGAAVVTVLFLDPYGQGKLVEFELMPNSRWSSKELVPILFLGILCGAVSGGLVRMNAAYLHWRSQTPWLANRPGLEVLLAVLLTGIVQYPMAWTRVGMLPLMATLFSPCPDLTTEAGRRFQFVDAASASMVSDMCSMDRLGSTIVLLLVAAMIKVLLQVICIGLKVPSGLFVPSLASGALIGRAVGLIVKLINNHGGDGQLVFANCDQDDQTICSAAYAILGAGGMLGGVTGMVFSLAVIMFELSSSVSQLVPLLVVLISSKVVSHWVAKGNVYQYLIHLKHLPTINHGFGLGRMATMPVAQFATQHLHAVVLGRTTVAEAQALLADTTVHGFPVLSCSGSGVITSFAVSGRGEQQGQQQTGPSLKGDSSNRHVAAGLILLPSGESDEGKRHDELKKEFKRQDDDVPHHDDNHHHHGLAQAAPTTVTHMRQRSVAGAASTATSSTPVPIDLTDASYGPLYYCQGYLSRPRLQQLLMSHNIALVHKEGKGILLDKEDDNDKHDDTTFALLTRGTKDRDEEDPTDNKNRRRSGDVIDLTYAVDAIPPLFSCKTHIDEVVRHFVDLGHAYAVVLRADGSVVGLVKRKDIAARMHHEFHDVYVFSGRGSVCRLVAHCFNRVVNWCTSAVCVV